LLRTLIALAVFAPLVAKGTVITGSISDEHGRPFERAHIYLESESGSATRMLSTIGGDGRFQVELREAGYFRLGFKALGHEDATVPIFITPARSSDTLLFDISLARPEWHRRITRAYFDGPWKASGDRSETRVVPGTLYTREVTADSDTLFFSLIGLEPRPDNTVHILQHLTPTDYDGVRFDPEENEFIYWKLSRPGERISLRLDVDRLWPPGDTATGIEQTLIRYGEGARWLQPLDSMERMIAVMYSTFHRITSEAQKRYNDNKDWYASRIARTVLDTLQSPVRNAIADILLNDPEARVREVAAAHLMTLLPYDLDSAAPFVKLARPLLTPHSPAWVLASREIVHYAPLLSPADSSGYLQSVIDGHPVADVRQQVLLDWMNKEHENRNLSHARDLRRRLTEEFGDDTGLQFLLSENTAPFDTVLTYEDRFPPFALPSLDGRGKVRFVPGHGRYTLVDIWSPDCDRCVKDLDIIRQADSIYGKHGLRIVSIAVDGNRERVKRTLDTAHPTWEQAFVPPSEHARYVRKFNVNELPKRYLINPLGEIVATEYHVSGRMLIDVLGWHLDTGV
jgi:hypothetical protein